MSCKEGGNQSLAYFYPNNSQPYSLLIGFIPILVLVVYIIHITSKYLFFLPNQATTIHSLACTTQCYNLCGMILYLSLYYLFDWYTCHIKSPTLLVTRGVARIVVRIIANSILIMYEIDLFIHIGEVSRKSPYGMVSMLCMPQH